MPEAKYKDLRQHFFRELFSRGLPYDEYVRSGSDEQQKRWASFKKMLSLSAQQQLLLQSFTRRMNVMVVSGTWCGDCARQGPMLRMIEQTSPCISMRFFDNKQFPVLQDELRINGAERVPVVVVLSEDFFEVLRFGDRHLSVYRRKARNELGPACDSGLMPPSEEDLMTELSEWVDLFERAQLILRLAPMLRQRYGD